ncbi:hypothetical protein JCM3765_005028 [Sporobolomyces pararoseus]
MSTQPPSLSSLPPELVHQIIESTVPHTFHSTTYKERQQTLCSLSLVSKLFRSIAQPLLLEIVKLQRLQDAGKLRAVGFAGGSAHLTYLQITHYYSEVPEAIYLPNLRDLTLLYVSFELFKSLLNSVAVPNLRNFALVEASDECARWVKESSTSAFLLRLETLLIDAVVWLELDESFRQSAASRTLVDVSWARCGRACTSTASIAHARLDCAYLDEEDFDDEKFCDELDDYASFIKTASSLSLRSFYLDSSFSDPSNLSQSTQLSINDLARVCQERKIDLVFEQVPRRHTTDPWISSEFIRRQKINRRNEVIESTVPHSFHTFTYKDRQSTLCRLSLVSRQFRSIAQPLLLQVIKLKLGRLSDAKTLDLRPVEEVVSKTGTIYQLVLSGANGGMRPTQEEKDRFTKSSRVFDTVRNLTTAYTNLLDFTGLLSIDLLHLTHLHLSYCDWDGPSRIRLPQLRSLTLHGVSPEIFYALVDPATVPNLRNFGIVIIGEHVMEYLAESKLDQLIPQLETIAFPASAWLDPRAAFLHSVASKTLVDFVLYNTKRLDYSNADLKHIRIGSSSLHSFLFTHSELQAHLDLWSALIQKIPSVSLKSIYLDSSLRRPEALPSATKFALETLIRVCQERKVDLVFEATPLDLVLDPYISSEFIQRQKGQSSKDGLAKGEMGRLAE